MTYDGCCSVVGYPGPLWNELGKPFWRLRNSSRKSGLSPSGARRRGGSVALTRKAECAFPARACGICRARTRRRRGQTEHFRDLYGIRPGSGSALTWDFDDVADELAESSIDFSFRIPGHAVAVHAEHAGHQGRHFMLCSRTRNEPMNSDTSVRFSSPYTISVLAVADKRWTRWLPKRAGVISTTVGMGSHSLPS